MNKKGIRTVVPYFLLIGVVIAALILFFCLYNFPRTRSNDYAVNSYHVSAFVKENGSIDIRETISVHFDKESHGIYRYIPLSSNVSFENGDKNYDRRYVYQISNIKSYSHKFYYSKENGNMVIMLGSPYSLADEYETYDFAYTLSLGNDMVGDFDQFYYNLIGDGWDTTIENFSVDIDFEKQISDRPIYFYVQLASQAQIEQQITNSHVSFSCPFVLQPFSPLTARVVLEEGYFSFPPVQTNVVDFLIAIISIVFLGIAAILFIVKNNKKKIVPIVEFSAPDGITPADAGYIVDRAIETGELSSLIVYWASKGYVKIVEEEEKVTVVKLKDCDDKFKNYEQNIFKAMFADQPLFDISTPSEKVGLAFVRAKNEVKAQNKKFFSSNVTTFKHLFLVIASILFALNVFFVAKNIGFDSLAQFLPILCLGTCMFLGLEMILLAKEKQLAMSKFSCGFCIFLGSLIVAGVWIFCSVALFETYNLSTLSVLLVPIILLPIIAFSFLFNDMVEDENHSLGKIHGLRKFIVTTEQSRIEVLAKENPQMFFDILPYAYVLGVSGVWIDKFKTVELACPSWYACSNPSIVNAIIATRIVSSLSRLDRCIVISIPRSSGSSISAGGHHFGGGHFGGGGHAGGGFGGGGGGRW